MSLGFSCYYVSSVANSNFRNNPFNDHDIYSRLLHHKYIILVKSIAEHKNCAVQVCQTKHKESARLAKYITQHNT